MKRTVVRGTRFKVLGRHGGKHIVRVRGHAGKPYLSYLTDAQLAAIQTNASAPPHAPRPAER